MWRKNKQQKGATGGGSGEKSDVTKKVETSKSISSRDMSLKTSVIKKVAEHCSDGKAEVTAAWNVDISGKQTRISFSRDNVGVWVNGRGVETHAFITDQGYDVDMFFDVMNSKCHIYSDVEGNKMMNYLVIDEELVGVDHKDFEGAAKQ